MLAEIIFKMPPLEPVPMKVVRLDELLAEHDALGRVADGVEGGGPEGEAHHVGDDDDDDAAHAGLGGQADLGEEEEDDDDEEEEEDEDEMRNRRFTPNFRHSIKGAFRMFWLFFDSL